MRTLAYTRINFSIFFGASSLKFYILIFLDTDDRIMLYIGIRMMFMIADGNPLISGNGQN